jgi:AcrR family transcriptional regulator
MNIRFAPVNRVIVRFMPKVSAEHRESRRSEILCAARRRFASEGFHATSMQDILEESGLSAGAVYSYFAGKSDIVAAIAGENVSTLLDALSASAQAPGEISVADAVVTALASVRAKDGPTDTARLALQVWAESARDPALCDRFAATHERFRAVIAGLIRARHPELADRADCMSGAVGALLPGFLLQLSLLEESRTADFEQGVRLVLGDL